MSGRKLTKTRHNPIAATLHVHVLQIYRSASTFVSRRPALAPPRHATRFYTMDDRSRDESYSDCYALWEGWVFRLRIFSRRWFDPIESRTSTNAKGKGSWNFFSFSNRDESYSGWREIFYWDIVKLFDRSNGSKNFSSNFEGMNVDEKCAVGNISGIRQIKWTKCEIRPFLFRRSSSSVNFKRLSERGR